MTIESPSPLHSNLWQLLSDDPQPVKVVDYPRYKNGQAICQVALRTFHLETPIKIQTLATLETDRAFKSEGKSLDQFRGTITYEERYKNIAAKYYLMEACRDPENHDLPFFPTPDDIARKCTLDEATLLVKWHRQLESECGPIIGMMSSQDEMDQWIRRLVEAGKEGGYFLERTLWEAKNELLTYMAHQLASSQTDRYSPTLPQDRSPESTMTETTNPEPQPTNT